MPLPLYAPDGTHGRSQLPVLLYLYGGGFTIRSITTHDGLCRRLCSLAGCAVLSLDYRLAPENKFPTAQNDAWDVLYWLASHGSECGLDTARIAVGGQCWRQEKCGLLTGEDIFRFIWSAAPFGIGLQHRYDLP